MLYRIFRALARLTLRIFFRQIEVEGLANVPVEGPVLLVPNHSNALVDPLVILTSLRRPVTVTAKNTLLRNPLLRPLMTALGVVTFHRREDRGQGADVRQNVHSLERCGDILARGGALCIFPEGVSHSDPKLRPFHLGAARIALDFIRKNGIVGKLQIVPVGLLYTEKDQFRSGVWIRFGPPLDAGAWVATHSEGNAHELTQEILGRVEDLTLNYETRREFALLTWAAEIISTHGNEPAPLGRDRVQVADWFALLERLQAGYRPLRERHQEEIEELAARIRHYRAELKRAGVDPAEVYLPLHPGKAFLFVVRELELMIVGAPLALFGAVNHVIPYLIVKKIARTLSKDKDHWASNVVYPSFVVFPLCYILQLAAAWLLLPQLWAFLYTLMLPYTGYYCLLYTERAARAFRRTRTFFSFLARPARQRRLADEGRAIIGQVQELQERSRADQDKEKQRAPTSLAGTAPTLADRAGQLRADCATLQEILPGLERLEAAMDEVRVTSQRRSRGYFTPDEDDRVRQLVLGYRNYRLALYEIIQRYAYYEDLGSLPQQLQGFIVGYTAALTLYAKSLKLITLFEDEPVVRSKLNEADAKFGLEGGFFDQVLGAYTSLWNYRRLGRAGRFWRSNQRSIRQLGLPQDERFGWLCQAIRRQRRLVRTRFWNLLRHRLRYDRRALWRSLTAPAGSVRYGLHAFLGSTFAGLRTTLQYRPALDTTIFEPMHALLRPGDIFLVRAEQKVTTALLPGFWTHAALYLGTTEEVAKLATSLPSDVHHGWENQSSAGQRFGLVLEAISPGVILSPLEKCLFADNVLVLRPHVDEQERAAALQEALGHIGKPYDFEFDFSTTTRLVCTELVYRSYHGRGSITFQLVKRLGRFTLSCDDMVNQWLESLDRGEPERFTPAALALQAPDGRAHFIPPGDAVAVLRAIRDGWRPNKTERPPLVVAALTELAAAIPSTEPERKLP
jgi:glycerol-3-phosphate O-acyltransferase/dihydroxyacetone phosphate acyltransferase